MCTSRGVDRIRKKKNQTHNCGAPHPAGLVLRDLHAIPPHTSLFRAASALLRGQHKICTKNIPRSRPGPAMFDRHRLTIDSLHETKPAGRTRNATQPNPTQPNPAPRARSIPHGLRLQFHRYRKARDFFFGSVRDMPTLASRVTHRLAGWRAATDISSLPAACFVSC
jgi:hypothetical protein